MPKFHVSTNIVMEREIKRTIEAETKEEAEKKADELAISYFDVDLLPNVRFLIEVESSAALAE